MDMDTIEMQPMTAFLADTRITMTASQVDDNPNMDDESRQSMDHWRCVFHLGRKRMAIFFSMGRGHNGREPELGDVLDCLASDAASVDNADTFDAWAAEYGYDTDSRRHERTYKTCVRQRDRLRAFLGEDQYQRLLWNTARM